MVHANSYCNRPDWVTLDLGPGSTVFLKRGLKSFARSRSLGQGHLLQFKFAMAVTLLVKFFEASSIRLECCTESSSGSDFESSSNSDYDNNTLGVKHEDFD
ncbi:hypothetical protein D1007_26557 [Hordeum vulgare]|nr:hypothetical protein D1007_26557 [Hordeum vulgare]